MVEMIVVNNHLSFTKGRLTLPEEEHYIVTQRAIIRVRSSRQKAISRTTLNHPAENNSNDVKRPIVAPWADGNDLAAGKLEAWNTDGEKKNK